MTRVSRAVAIVLAIAFSTLILHGSLPEVSTGSWQPVGTMVASRSGAASVKLLDGQVMFIGGIGSNGAMNSAEVFGNGGAFSAVASMNEARSAHTATLLDDGRVLVAGGDNGNGATNTIEIYDPAFDSWTSVGALLTARSGHTASRLKNGNVLIAGGENAGGPLSSLEVFDPRDNSVSNAGTMSFARAHHAAAVMGDGRIMIVGGSNVDADSNTVALNSVEIYDPADGSVSAAANLSTARASLSATTLLDGRVFVAGGNDGSQDLASGEIYDAATNSWNATGSMVAARSGHSAFLLPNNNNVMIVGGTSAGVAQGSVELFASWNNSFKATTAMTSVRAGGSGSALANNGLFLMAGGAGNTSGELYRFATVMTDADDYPPGTPVYITGSGWQPGETVTLSLEEVPFVDQHESFTTVADADGNILDFTWAPDEDDANLRFYLTATGSVSEAYMTFTDSVPNKVTVGAQTPNPIAPGGVASFPVTIAFSGPASPVCTVALSVASGLPAGATPSFSGTVSSNTSVNNPATMTITTTGATPGGTSTIVVRATNTAGSCGGAVTILSSAPAGTNGTLVVDTTAPTVSSINRASGTPTNAASVNFNVTFSESVTGVDTGDFALVTSGVSGASISSVTGTGATRTVAVNTGTGDGTIGLNLVDDDTIADSVGNKLGGVGAGNGSFTGQVYTIDKTKPTISAAFTPAQNVNGWNTTNVDVLFSCSDSAATQAVNNINSTQNVTSALTCTDAAGNTADQITVSVKIDKNNPAATLSPGNGTYNAPFSYTWGSSDGNSGIDPSTCNVTVDAGSVSTACSGTLPLGGGTHTVVFSASDMAGRSDSVSRTYTVITDNTPPVITPVITGTLGSNGWYTSNVDVKFTVTDGESTVTSRSTSCTTDATTTTINTDTTGTTVSCTATSSGGTATQSVTIKRDATAPIVSATPDVAANGFGWNNTDVTVSYTCNADISGLNAGASSLGNDVLSSSGTATGTCVDNAGNSASANYTAQIDKVKPVIAGSRTPAANSFGWNNSDIEVTFSCSDSGGSGVDTNSVAGSTVSTEGANQSVTNTGSCTDKAGNSADSATVSDINIDKTNPVISGSRLPLANSFGWNNSDVAVSFSCADALSGVDADSVAGATVSAEGANQSVTNTGSCTDKAGNSASSATVSDISIDKSAPIVTATPSIGPNVNGWNNSDVTVSYSCNADISGVDAGSSDLGNDVLSASGTATGTCVDKAGNSASASHSALIDKDKPVITGSRTPAANSFGWNNSDVTASFSCSDVGDSGLDANTVAGATVTTEGKNQTVTNTGSCTDKAGNSADSATVSDINIDKTNPVISGSRLPLANSFGWNNSDVAVSFSCADALSGVDADSVAGATVSAEGANQSVTNTGSCTDKAGNSASSATVSGINIDKSAPIVTATPDIPANGYGWNNSDVTVSYSCNADISGLDVAGSSLTDDVLSSSGTATGTCVDQAGNSASANYSALIDKQKPVITGLASPAANANGWNNSNVGVSFSCADVGDSGIATDNVAGATLTGEGAGQSVTNSGSCTDKAGNIANSATVSGINIDKTAPTLTGSRTPAANSFGWNNTDVTASFVCTDGLSGVFTGPSTPQVVSTEGAGQSRNASCTDAAGNVSNATVSSISIDKTKPSLLPAVAPNPAILNGSATGTPNASDSLSGIDTQSCPAAPTNTVGSHTITCTATDKAGNTNTADATYGVNYATGGACLGEAGHQILQPINWQGDSISKQGSTVPAKFRVCDALGHSISTPGVVSNFALVGIISGLVTTVEDLPVDSTTPDNMFRWSASDQQWIYNISTKNSPFTKNKTYLFRITLNDGTFIDFRFGLK